MKDFAIRLENRPGALAEMGEALAEAGISIEGGGAWSESDGAIAHFLFEDGTDVKTALAKRTIHVLKESAVLVQRLKQYQPGQPGKIAGLMQHTGTDDYAKGKIVPDNRSNGPYE